MDGNEGESFGMRRIKSSIIRRKPETTKPTSLPASDELLPVGGALDGMFHLELQFPVDELELIPTGIALATKPTPLFYPPSHYSKFPALQHSASPFLHASPYPTCDRSRRGRRQPDRRRDRPWSTC